jgi:hypothetical protein
MAPSRPLMFGEQLALVILVVLAIAAGIWVAARAF